MQTTLNRFTLVVPTQNRHNYLRRLLSYYSGGKGYFDIIICDSSAKPFPDIAVFNLNNNIRYNHYPGYLFTEKIYQVFFQIETEYVAFCADDDFIMINSIIESIKFLDTNSSYSSVQGKYIAFEKDSNNNFNVMPMYLNTVGVDLENEAPVERLDNYNKNYFQLFYAVFKSEVFKEIILSGRGLKNLNLYEILLGYVGLILGKHKVLPFLHSAREMLKGSSGFADNIDIVSTDPKYKEEYSMFVTNTALILSKKMNINLEAARKIVMDQVAGYIAYIGTLQVAKKSNQNIQIKFLIKKILPEYFKTMYRIKVYQKNHKMLLRNFLVNETDKIDYKELRSFLSQWK